MSAEKTETDPLAAALAKEAETPAHPILSAKEVEEARAEAKKRIEAEQKKKAKAALIDEETRRLQQEEGFSADGGVMGEIVSLTLELAPHQPDIRLDGKVYMNRVPYKVTRAVAASLREIEAKGWQHQDHIEGKSTFEEAGRRERNPHFSAAVN